MVDIRDRELFLVKKALAIAVMVIEANDSPFQASSDLTEMKGMLDRLMESDGEMAFILHAARIQITGRPD